MEGLGRRILVAAFDGWNDAGEAASAALALLKAEGAYEPVHSVDPELYFDYQYTRPQVGTDADGRRTLTWPQATILRPVTASEDPQVWLLTGVEPARAWQAFAAELVDVALREDVTGFVGLGSMMSDVPHTRPISVFAGSDNDRLRGALDLERSSYEGPVGILSVLAQSAEDAGIPSASLWASVPHYVAGHTPSPKATLALLDRLEKLPGAHIPRGALAAEWRRRGGGGAPPPGGARAAAPAGGAASTPPAAADDEEMTEYIRGLEQTRDAWDSPEASGDAIAREFEQYLRRRGDGPGKPGPDGPRR